MAPLFPTPRHLLAVALLATLTGCDKPLTEPRAEPGALTLSLTTPYDDDRGLILEVSGPRSPSVVEPLGEYRIHSRVSGDLFRVAVFGAIQDGAVLTFRVPDVGEVSEYSARVLEAADASSALRPSTAGYSVQIGR